jgi:hypothetical protein
VSRILRLALEQVAASLRAACPSLASARVESAPPDTASEYPAIALVPDRFVVDPGSDDEILEEDGVHQVAPGGRPLASVGALRGSCRLFVAARLPAQRGVLEDQLTTAFFQDDTAPSRLMATLSNVEVGGIATGVDWNVAVFVADDEWRDEMAFSERRWAYRKLDVDVPILVLRSAVTQALVTQMVATLTADLETTVDDPTDLTNPGLAPLAQRAIAADGSISLYP